jgi:HAD superfamily hydrolase (TIGR01509 family)
MGVELTDALYAGFIGLNRMDTVTRLGEIWASSCVAAQFVDLSQTHYDRLVHDEGHQLRSGVTTLLEFLKARRLRMAVATSSHRSLALKTLEDTGLSYYFAAVVAGDEVERGKPHPEIYLTAASRIGVPSAHCVAFEDSVAGARAALDAGMTVVWIPELGDGLSSPDPKVLRYRDHAAATALFAQKTC